MVMHLRQYMLSAFLIGFFTFTVEIAALRVLGMYFGFSMVATSSTILVFILGMSAGSLLYIRTQRAGYAMMITAATSVAAIVGAPKAFAALPPSLLAYAVFLLYVPLFLAGAASSYWYVARMQCRSDIAWFIAAYSAGSLIGGAIPLLVAYSIGMTGVLVACGLAISVIAAARHKWVAASLIALQLAVFFAPVQISAEIEARQAVLSDMKEVEFPYAGMNEYLVNGTGEVLFRKPSPYGEVVVDSNMMLSAHREILCDANSTDERALADIALRLDPEAAETLIIGLGCGQTLDAYLERSHANITVVEINPVVVEAQRLFFAEGDNPVDSPRVTLVVDDGYRHVQQSAVEYDTIIIDVSNPLAIESSHVFTKEFNAAIRDNLDDEGVLVWWNFRTTYEFERVQYGTIRAEFPYVQRKELPYSTVFVAGRSPFFIELTESEAERLTAYERSSLLVNSIDKPVFR